MILSFFCLLFGILIGLIIEKSKYKSKINELEDLKCQLISIIYDAYRIRCNIQSYSSVQPYIEECHKTGQTCMSTAYRPIDDWNSEFMNIRESIISIKI